MEVLRLRVVREADAVLASLVDWLAQVSQNHVDRLFDFFALFENVLTLVIVSWFESSQVADHEV